MVAPPAIKPDPAWYVVHWKCFTYKTTPLVLGGFRVSCTQRIRLCVSKKALSMSTAGGFLPGGYGAGRARKQKRGSVHGTATQGSPAAGNGQKHPGKSRIRRAQTGAQEHRLAPAGLRAASTARQGQICTHTHGRQHPSCKPRLPPRRCKSRGDEEQVAGGCSDPSTSDHNPVLSDTTGDASTPGTAA